MDAQVLSLAEIIASISTLCRDRRTGTLFVKNGHRLVGQVGIENGEIVFLFSLGRRGMAALPLLFSATGGGHATFVAGQVPIRIPLPPTAEILKALSQPVAIPGSPEKGPTPAGDTLSGTTRAVLEATLREFIGPIAGAVCADVFRAGGSLEGVVAALVAELPSREMAGRFRELVRQRLN